MKHLKSSLGDLRKLFEGNVNVRHLTEPCASFDGLRLADEVRSFMDPPRDYDVVGVRKDGLIKGYVNRVDLGTGVLDDYIIPFEPEFLLDESANLLDALSVLRKTPHVYVKVMGQVFGIVTKGDLQKAPVRMWLFGLISFIEMQFLRLIRDVWPEESWTKSEMISPDRLEKAREMLVDRQRRNEAIDLADCLQFGDKITIVLKNKRLRETLGFENKSQGETILKKLRNLRDELAHAQDILTGRWPELFDLAVGAENILERAEGIDVDLARNLCAPPVD